MSDYWNYIKDFYSKKSFFTCEVMYEKDKTFEVVPEHSFVSPALEKMVKKLQKKIKKENEELKPKLDRMLSRKQKK